MKVSKIWFKGLPFTPSSLSNQPAFSQARDTLRQQISRLLTSQRFVSFANHASLYFDNQLHCLWLLYSFRANANDMQQYVEKLKLSSFHTWQIPSLSQLQTITTEKLFTEHPKLAAARIYSATSGKPKSHFRTITVGKQSTRASAGEHTIVPIHQIAEKDIFSFIIAHALVPANIPGIEDSLEQLTALYAMRETSAQSAPESPPISIDSIKHNLLYGDSIRANLPILEASSLVDISKGLWEIYQPERPQGPGWIEINLGDTWEARNPEQDIREGVIAIDFGTSSTVVACREQGETTLLRIGMRDFFTKPTPADYENPTILEFINLPNLLSSWQAQFYRPLTHWNDIHFSHVAREHYRENEANQDIVASMLTDLKQWPLKDKPLSNKQCHPIRIVDQTTRTELELPTTESNQPAANQPQVCEHDPFNPIELYAYYLGLFINHRTNGLFLEYYMTFPITYPRKTKEFIRQSFTRGLQRSLPEALTLSPLFSRFAVTEEGSEPAAYAACALDSLQIEPTANGTAFAVFDFGGGTTDFDFGLYRLPNQHESAQGYEHVIQSIGASGDTFLGGENLIKNLAFNTFKHNLEVCRKFRIPFVLPDDASRFPGHEPFIDNTHVAQTNSALLMAKIRPLWENFQWPDADQVDSTGTSKKRRKSDRLGDIIRKTINNEHFDIISSAAITGETMTIELLNRNQEKVAVDFIIAHQQLNHFLVQRVGRGVMRFFIAMQQAYASRPSQPQQIHILLAGNASRSLLVQAIFAAILQDKMAGWQQPQDQTTDNGLAPLLADLPAESFIVHRPPNDSADNLYQPTAKTGVAIGLLNMIPGETLLATGITGDGADKEAPFGYFAGCLKKGIFLPVIPPNTPYYQWYVLGTPIRQVFNLFYSDSPQASSGSMRRNHPELHERSLRFESTTKGKKVFVQALTPATIEVCLAKDLVQINTHPNDIEYRQTIDLIR